MPNVNVSLKDMQRLVGKKLSLAEFKKAVLFAKGEVEAVEGDSITVDVKDTNRPDLWSAEGIARELRARLGVEKGLPKYAVKKSKLVVKIEKSVKGTRPFTVGAIVKGVKVSDEMLRQVIHLQEKADGTFGRNRKEAATGIYDFDKIQGNIRYYGANPRKTKFVPLEFKQELDLDEILELHPKGKEYGHLLKGKKLYPIFEDGKGHILSMPPVINSNYSGKVTEATKNLFIEVSGFDEERIETALNVITLAIAERGGRILTVKVVDSNGKAKWTPNLSPKKIEVKLDDVREIIGLRLKDKEIVGLLERARYKARVKGKKAIAEYPCYRMDILHQVDVIEDILISYGYDNIEPEPMGIAVVGEGRPETRRANLVREICVGLGLQGTLTYTMTNKKKQAALIGLDSEKEQFVELANPVSERYTVFRKRLYPELLEFLSENKHVAFPQKVFEVGKTIELNPKSETGVSEKNRLCIVLSGKGAEFTVIKGVLDAVADNLGENYSLRECGEPSLERGKSTAVSLSGKKGFLGELTKGALQNFGLEQPTAVLEIEI